MILLDTHVLIWALRLPEKLSAKAMNTMSKAKSLAVSSASLYEISLKARLGKWPEAEDLLAIDLSQMLRSNGIEILPATGPIMQRAGSFDWHHRDPFDRLIAATAIEHGLMVVSKDVTLDSLGDKRAARIW